jgi:hypothetical protein
MEVGSKVKFISGGHCGGKNKGKELSKEPGAKNQEPRQEKYRPNWLKI